MHSVPAFFEGGPRFFRISIFFKYCSSFPNTISSKSKLPHASQQVGSPFRSSFNIGRIVRTVFPFLISDPPTVFVLNLDIAGTDYYHKSDIDNVLIHIPYILFYDRQVPECDTIESNGSALSFVHSAYKYIPVKM